MKIGETKLETTYEVEYQYYRYNTGRGDNGYFTGTKRLDSESVARSLVNKIELHCQGHLNEEESTELEDWLIGDPGHFLKEPIKVYKVISSSTLVFVSERFSGF